MIANRNQNKKKMGFYIINYERIDFCVLMDFLPCMTSILKSQLIKP